MQLCPVTRRLSFWPHEKRRRMFANDVPFVSYYVGKAMLVRPHTSMSAFLIGFIRQSHIVYGRCTPADNNI